MDRIDQAEPEQLLEFGSTIVAEARVGGESGDLREPGFAESSRCD
jgi:hypothetical protein